MRARAGAIAVVLTGFALAGCTEVEESASVGYEPAHLEEVEGSELQRVTFTREGADRTGLRTDIVQRDGAQRVVPYASLIYDGEGKTWVYTLRRPLTFQRAEVRVGRVERDRAVIAEGPPAGSRVVTVGASEVYGAELEIAGGH
jgi:hypothetical protein